MPTRRAITLPLVAPIVPVLRDHPFDDLAYLFEPKYDGFRGLLYLSGRECHLARSVATSSSSSSSSVTGSGKSCGSKRRFSVTRSWRSIQREGLRPLPLRRRTRALERVIPATTTVLSRVFAVEGRGRDLFAAAERTKLR